MKDTDVLNTKNFERDITNFFEKQWTAAKKLDDSIIEKYEKREKATAETHKIPDEVPYSDTNLNMHKQINAPLTLYRKFKSYLQDSSFWETPLKIQQVYDKVKSEFPLDCDDSVIVIYDEKPFIEWQAQVRRAVFNLTHARRGILSHNLDGTYQLKEH